MYFKINRYEKYDSVVKCIGSYFQPKNEIQNAIDAEVSGIEDSSNFHMITIEASNLTDEEYEKLPEFSGY